MTLFVMVVEKNRISYADILAIFLTEFSCRVNILYKGGDQFELSERIKLILEENQLKQKELAKEGPYLTSIKRQSLK